MKYCPNCQTTYGDDGLRFCPRDGTSLREVSDVDDSGAPTVVFDDAETILASRRVEPIRVPIDNPPTAARQQQQYQRQNEPPPVIAIQPPIRKSRTGLAVGLTILGMLLVFGIAGVGALLYFQNKRTEIAAVNNNAAPVNSSNNSRPAANTNSANAATPNQNSNSNLANVSPTPTASPKPTLDPRQAKEITDNVRDVVDEWKSSTENLDIDDHLNQYADTVDYYKAGKVGAARVRADRERAFRAFDSLVVKISNLKITPDASGEKATAVFDKEWSFSGEEKSSDGKVQQQLTFAKIGGRWKITGEKDLTLYYKQ